MFKKSLLGAAVALAGFSSSAIADTQTMSVSVGGGDYTLTTVFGSFNDNQTRLESQDWWGDSKFAFEIARAVLHGLGDSAGNVPAVSNVGAAAAYGAPDSSTIETFAYAGIPGVRSGPSDANTAYSFIVVYEALASTSSAGLRPEKQTLAPDFIPSNVPTCDGGTFVSGFQIVGNGRVQWYVEASKADNCFNVDVNVLPEGVRTYDVERVLAYLGNVELDVYKRQ